MALITSGCVPLQRDSVVDEPVRIPHNLDYPRTRWPLITSDCDAMRLREHQTARITSGCAPSQVCVFDIAAVQANGALVGGGGGPAAEPPLAVVSAHVREWQVSVTALQPQQSLWRVPTAAVS